MPRSGAGVGRPRRGSPRREQPAPRAWRGPGVFASRCCGYTPRRSEIAGWVLQDKIAPCRLPRPGGVPERSERRGLLAQRRMSPLPPAQRQFTRLARLLLRQRGSVARLCPIQAVTHGPARADHAAPERPRRAAPQTRSRRRALRSGRTGACTQARTAVTAQFRVTGDRGARGSVRIWAGNGTDPAARFIDFRGSAAPREPTGCSANPWAPTGPNATRAANARLDAPLVDPAHRLDEESRMNNYWPWWAGAIGLALVTINYTLTTDRSLGVSSAWDRVLHWRSERRLEVLDAQFADDRALVDAFAAATADQFGTGPGALTLPDAERGDAQAAGQDVGPAAAESAPVASLRPAPLVTQAALLLSILFGGWIAAVAAGRFQLRLDMGNGYRQLVTANPTTMIVVLFVGGVLVGFGTRLAGGCSSGHGLSGCGRLRPVSILATAVFFGTAVVVSFLLWKVI